MAIRVNSAPLIPDINGLTAAVSAEMQASPSLSAAFTAVVERGRTLFSREPTVEDLLSSIRLLREVIGVDSVGLLNASKLDELDAAICAKTTQVTSVDHPSDDGPFHKLATWIGAISRREPVEIFTPNYDLLIEQALEARRIPYFDGFVGGDRPFFDLASIEHDDLPSRWTRLWKIHGSINWWRTKGGHVERKARGAPPEPGDRQMIHPSHLKYDQSRRMPYLVMFDRLKDFLSEGPAVLVACGYSFSDQHLNEAILHGLNRNPNAICFALMYGDKSSYPDAVKSARGQANLNVLAADGAVLGTVERDWGSVVQSEHFLNGVAVCDGDLSPKARTAAPSNRCKFLLGDFAALSAFLAHQLAFRGESDGAP